MSTRLVGNTEGLSEPASSVEELAEEYNKCQVFLNTSTLSPIPTTLLEAMACGCAVVSTATCMIPEIIVHGENGMISNDEQELTSYIQQLMEDEHLRTKIGSAARETILSKFSEGQFIHKWNSLFDEVIK
jgi:glycosyltransferase involved in cell wall biosynthesis